MIYHLSAIPFLAFVLVMGRGEPISDTCSQALRIKLFEQGPLNFATHQDEIDYYYRRAHGHENVVWAAHLVDSYRSGELGTRNLLEILFRERPYTTALILARNPVVDDRFLFEVIVLEADTPIGEDSSGRLVYFDHTKFLDSIGQVAREHVGDYTLAVQANGIPRPVLTASHRVPE